nr:BTB/POZ domain-containing protein 19 isoform X4 [Microcebus murinus]
MGGASSAPSSSFHRNPQASHPGAGVGRLPARPYPPASLPHPRPLQPRFLLAPPQAYSYPGAPGLRSPLPSGTWASLSYCPSASGLSSLTSSRARPGLLGRSLPHPWRAPDWWCAGRLRPFLQHSEASSTTPGTGCWQKRKILSPLDPESDVRFVVGQERQEVFAHRCLLACRCSFFQRLLGSEPGPRVPSPVVLSTVPAEAFLAVLEFLYTNSVKLHRHSVLEVLTAAVEYGLEELREVGFCARSLSHFPCLSWATSHPASQTLWPGEERVPTQRGVWMSFCLCLEFVVKVLDVELVCEALQVAVTFGLGPLQERCIAFIEAHSQEALRTRGFLELSAPALLPLLRSDKLCVDEAELVWAARSWARVGAVSWGWGSARTMEEVQAAGTRRAGGGLGSGLAFAGGTGAACGRGGSTGGERAATGLVGSSRAERPGRAEPEGAVHPGADAGRSTQQCGVEALGGRAGRGGSGPFGARWHRGSQR